MQRPFAFWLPAFILLFILWAWVISCYQSIRIAHWKQDYQSGRSVLLIVDKSRFSLRFSRGRGDHVGTPTSSTRYFREIIPADHSGWWFPLPSFEHKDESIPGIRSHSYHFIVPYWLIVLLYLGLWRFAVRRHDRRLARARDAHGLPAAESQTDG